MCVKKTIFFVALLCGLTLSVKAQVAKFKAAYLYNICRFIEWPPINKTDDFVIGIVGEDEVEKELLAISRKKKILGRDLKIIKMSYASVSNCHLLYVSENNYKHIPEMVVAIGNNPTLIVGEKKGALNKGAAVNFFLSNNKLKFEVKKVNATRQGLKISPAIFKLATNVY